MAENGAFVKDRKELIFTADMSKEMVDSVIDVCREYPCPSNEEDGVLVTLEKIYAWKSRKSEEDFLLFAMYFSYGETCNKTIILSLLRLL